MSSGFSSGRCWNGESSGTQSGEPQSISIRTSSIWRIYASGVVWEERAAPDKGVKVIIAAKQLFICEAKQRLENDSDVPNSVLNEIEWILTCSMLDYLLKSNYSTWIGVHIDPWSVTTPSPTWNIITVLLGRTASILVLVVCKSPPNSRTYLSIRVGGIAFTLNFSVPPNLWQYP